MLVDTGTSTYRMVTVDVGSVTGIQRSSTSATSRPMDSTTIVSVILSLYLVRRKALLDFTIIQTCTILCKHSAIAGGFEI